MYTLPSCVTTRGAAELQQHLNAHRSRRVYTLYRAQMQYRADLVLLVIAAGAVAAAPPPTLVDHPIASSQPPQYLDGSTWSASNSLEPGAPPLSATVPGDILTDLARAGRVPNPYYNVSWQTPGFIRAWNRGI